MKMFIRLISVSVALVTSFMSLTIYAQPIFDTHLHYSAADAKVFSPKNIVQFLDKNNIRYAAVTGTPAVHVKDLYQFAPDRIVPLLSPYTKAEDKQQWLYDTSVIENLDKAIASGNWAGIGELHVFARDRYSPVLDKIVNLAANRKLPILLHGDPAVIDAVFQSRSDVTIIWAHAGTYPYPDLVTDYLQRYPGLFVDLSMRDERIEVEGEIDDSWYELLNAHSERFMVGVDSYSLARWREFDNATSSIRHWLEQLPVDVQQKIAYDNAKTLFKKKD